MDQESAFRNLIQQLYELGAVLTELRRTMVDFGPGSQQTALVDLFHDPLDELVGAQQEALYGAIAMHQAVQAGTDAERLKRQMAACESVLLGLDTRFHQKLAGWDPFSVLETFARENGEEGVKWVSTVQAAITGCQCALDAIHQALLDCWQGLVSLAGKTYISIQAGNNTQLMPARGQALEQAQKGAQHV